MSRSILDYDWLEIVPSGQTSSLRRVFESLGIAETRLADRRLDYVDSVATIVWQISSSYDLSCMTNFTNEETIHDYEVEHFIQPDREVYGIRIVKRSDNVDY